MSRSQSRMTKIVIRPLDARAPLVNMGANSAGSSGAIKKTRKESQNASRTDGSSLRSDFNSHARLPEQNRAGKPRSLGAKPRAPGTTRVIGVRAQGGPNAAFAASVAD